MRNNLTKVATILTLLCVVAFAQQKSTFKDSRDGKTYKTVKIGQNWMAENLNYKTKGSMCYDNKAANCNKYGSLYVLDEAVKVCPSGWHLPSEEEWKKLIKIAGSSGNKLNANGFSVQFGGFGGLGSGLFNSSGIGQYDFWWSSDITSAGAYALKIYGDDYDFQSPLAYLFLSVRCVQYSYKPKTGYAGAYNTALLKHLDEAAYNLALLYKDRSKPKGEFETTEQYNQRLKEDERLFNENSEENFLKAIAPTVEYIQTSIDSFPLILEKYNADKGIYTVVSNTDKWKNKHAGQFKISTDEAMQLRNARDLKIHIDPSDVYFSGHNLSVAKAEILLGDKKYTVEFPKAKNAQDTLFRGSELWEDNPAAKNFAFTFIKAKAAVEVMAKQEEEKAAVAKAKADSLAAIAAAATAKAEADSIAAFDRAYRGYFTDSRDRKKYKTIKIGKQTWMAENLNYETEGSKCYGENPANCQKYGRLYKWEAAMKACPNGWHLPSREEWNTLAPVDDETVGNKLKAKNGWENGNGTDSYGFSALPGGRGLSYGGFVNAGKFGDWWSASEGRASIRAIAYNGWDTRWYGGDKSDLYSVRCLKD